MELRLEGVNEESKEEGKGTFSIRTVRGQALSAPILVMTSLLIPSEPDSKYLQAQRQNGKYYVVTYIT